METLSLIFSNALCSSLQAHVASLWVNLLSSSHTDNSPLRKFDKYITILISLLTASTFCGFLVLVIAANLDESGFKPFWVNICLMKGSLVHLNSNFLAFSFVPLAAPLQQIHQVNIMISLWTGSLTSDEDVIRDLIYSS